MAIHHGIEEPVSIALGRVLRRAVVDHAGQESRRVFPMVLHVGFPGHDHRTLPLHASWELDHTLRVDIVEAITRAELAADRVPLLWLTRPVTGTGSARVETISSDLAWSAAVSVAGAELGVRLDLVVVTQHSWHDPRTGVGRTWQRARQRTPAPG